MKKCNMHTLIDIQFIILLQINSLDNINSTVLNKKILIHIKQKMVKNYIKHTSFFSFLIS